MDGTLNKKNREVEIKKEEISYQKGEQNDEI